MLSINTADLKQLSGSEKVPGLWETYVWHKRLSALQTGTLIRAYPAAGLLRALYKPQGYFPSRQKKVIHMQLQLLRNLRLVQATFRSSSRHSHLSLPGCRFTAGTLEIPYFSSSQTTVICKAAFLCHHRVVQGWLSWKYNLEKARPASLRCDRDLVKGVLHSLSKKTVNWRADLIYRI